MYRIFLFRSTFFILYISLRLTFLNMDNMDMNDDDSQIFTNKGKKRGCHKSDIWDYFQEDERIQGYCTSECNFCSWKQAVRQPKEMIAHIAFTCPKAPHNIKTIFLEKVKKNGKLGYKDNNKNAKLDSNQPKITRMFESIKIEQNKVEMANRAIVRFFACCGIPFHVVENPFFVDLLRILCLGYYPSSRNTLSGNMLNAEISHITTEINLKINEEKYLTLGLDGWTSPQGAITLRICFNNKRLKKIFIFSSKFIK